MTHPPAPSIRPATPADAAAIAHIYNHYIAHTVITFEEAPVSAEEVAARVQGVQALALPWLVMTDPDNPSGALLGYAYANRWRARSAYRFTAETSVYLDPAATGRGLGLTLYSHLLSTLRATTPLHTLIAGIALPNPASVRLHERLGFQHVGTYPAVGFKFNQWIDVGDWSLELK
jgi:L-amino acid N-acyltransferase YncA